MSNNASDDEHSAWDLVDNAARNRTSSAGGSDEGKQVPPSIHEYLRSKGLSDKWIDAVAAETDAATAEDLALLSVSVVEQVIQTLALKPVTAEKFRRAVAEQRDKQAVVTKTTLPCGEAEKDSDIGVTSKTAGGRGQSAMPKECVAICIDRSGSMQTPLAENTINYVAGAIQERTRMEAVKTMFYAFRDRLEQSQHGGNDGKHQLGLIQFDHDIERLLDPTSNLELFEAVVDDMACRGATAIFSSIVEAVAMLEQILDQHPGDVTATSTSTMDLRVLVLSDGQSNSGAPPCEALKAVARIGAVVDALIVGDRPDASLLKLVSVTGGQAWQIQSLGQGFELMENEGVVSLEARRGGEPKPPRRNPDSMLKEFVELSKSPLSQTKTLKQTATVVRPASMDLTSVKLADIQTTVQQATKEGNAIPTGSVKRLIKELTAFSASDDIYKGIHIFPCESDLRLWRALVEGPEGSPFEGGTFPLSVRIPDDYPFKPPKILFDVPVYHCNMSSAGGICLDLLQDQWSPSATIPQALAAIRNLLAVPDTNNALRPDIAELTIAHRANEADTRYYDEATMHTKKHAARTVAEWKKEWQVAGSL